MDEKRFVAGGKTPVGLDATIFDESVEINLARMPFGVSVEVVDLRGSDRESVPVGSYLKMTFFKPGNASGTRDVDNIPLPGAIYLTQEGVMIRGARPLPGTNRSAIDYSDRV